MSDFLEASLFFGAALTVAAYEVGLLCRKKWNKAFVNPLLIAILLTISVLLIFRIPYATYNISARYVSYLLTPTTVCLAVPLYEQLEILKKNYAAILLGILAGAVTSMLVVLLFSVLCRFTHAEYVSFLPKSVTTAIGMGISEELGGSVPITVAMIVLTGVLGNIIAETVCRVFRITDPVARGVGIGTASHAIGTTRAMEMGSVEGAISGLSILVAGLMTSFGAILMSYLY